jgi:hypothetical protein
VGDPTEPIADQEFHRTPRTCPRRSTRDANIALNPAKHRARRSFNKNINRGTGSAVSELRAGDVDWTNRVVVIERQLYPGYGRLVTKETKGRRARP